MAWLRKDQKDQPIPTDCRGQGCHSLNQAAQSPIQPSLEYLWGWGIRSFSSSLCQCLTALWVKNFPLTCNLNHPCLTLKSFPPFLSLSDWVIFRTYEYMSGSSHFTPLYTCLSHISQHPRGCYGRKWQSFTEVKEHIPYSNLHYSRLLDWLGMISPWWIHDDCYW